MKLQFSKSLFTFILTMMMFSLIPGISNAQQSGIANAQQGLDNVQSSCRTCTYVCGCGLTCVNGHCRRVFPWYTDPLHTKDVLSISGSNPADYSLQLTEAQYVPLKIYDITGRLIKTRVDSRLQQGENQIAWNKTDDDGSPVSDGLYIFHQ